jgi:hypothetical protein
VFQAQYIQRDDTQFSDLFSVGDIYAWYQTEFSKKFVRAKTGWNIGFLDAIAQRRPCGVGEGLVAAAGPKVGAWESDWRCAIPGSAPPCDPSTRGICLNHPWVQLSGPSVEANWSRVRASPDMTRWLLQQLIVPCDASTESTGMSWVAPAVQANCIDLDIACRVMLLLQNKSTSAYEMIVESGFIMTNTSHGTPVGPVCRSALVDLLRHYDWIDEHSTAVSAELVVYSSGLPDKSALGNSRSGLAPVQFMSTFDAYGGTSMAMRVDPIVVGGQRNPFAWVPFTLVLLCFGLNRVSDLRAYWRGKMMASLLVERGWVFFIDLQLLVGFLSAVMIWTAIRINACNLGVELLVAARPGIALRPIEDMCSLHDVLTDRLQPSSYLESNPSKLDQSELARSVAILQTQEILVAPRRAGKILGTAREMGLQNEMLDKLAALLVLLLAMRVVRQFNLQPRLAIVTRTLRHILPDLGHFVFLIAVELIGFSIIGNFLWGKHMSEFKDLANSVLTLYFVMLGDTDVFVEMARWRLPRLCLFHPSLHTPPPSGLPPRSPPPPLPSFPSTLKLTTRRLSSQHPARDRDRLHGELPARVHCGRDEHCAGDYRGRVRGRA